MIILLLIILLIMCSIYFKKRILERLQQLKDYLLLLLNGPVVPPIYKYDQCSPYPNWVFLQHDDETIKHLSWHEDSDFSDVFLMYAS